jgi:hypothetical protein
MVISRDDVGPGALPLAEPLPRRLCSKDAKSVNKRQALSKCCYQDTAEKASNNFRLQFDRSSYWPQPPFAVIKALWRTRVTLSQAPATLSQPR